MEARDVMLGFARASLDGLEVSARDEAGTSQPPQAWFQAGGRAQMRPAPPHCPQSLRLGVKLERHADAWAPFGTKSWVSSSLFRHEM